MNYRDEDPVELYFEAPCIPQWHDILARGKLDFKATGMREHTPMEYMYVLVILFCFA
jgi:hypothetical protein